MMKGMDVTREGEVRVGAVYEHYKGQRYRILALAREEATRVPVVVYQALYDTEDFGNQPIWTRPLAEFIGTVTVGGEVRSRFRHIEDSVEAQDR